MSTPTSKPWEQFSLQEDTPHASEPWLSFQTPGVAASNPKRSLVSAINDNVIEAANAAAGTASAVANFVRPGNALSDYIDKNIIEAGNAKQSDVVKAEKARYAQEMEQAQGFGDEVSATLGYVARNPLLAAAQAAGSFAGPGLAVGGARAAAGALGMVGKAATRTGLAAGAGFGMASAGGDAAGTAYELSRQGGATDEQALAAARGASVIPAAIGAAGGLVGAERLVAGAKGFTGGLAARALKTGAVEGAQEALEEGVTQYEGQRAAVPFNPDLDPTKGVAGAATMGAVLGGMTGGGTSLLTRQNQPARKPSEDLGLNPDSGPISKVAAVAVDGGRAAVPVQPEQPAQPEDGLSLAPEEQAQPQGPTLEERLAALPEQARAQAEQLLREIADERVPAGVKRFRAHELQQILDAYPVPEKTDTITPEERAAIGPIVRGYDPATGEAPGRPLELEGERYQDGIDFTTDEQPSQSAYQDAINRIALESYQTPGQPLAMEQASRLRDAAQEQGIPATIVPHPSGKGFDVQATAVLPEDARQQVAQDPVAAALPYDNSPTGRMVADAQGNARPELRPEAVEREVRWNQELAQMDAEARRRAELGLSNRTPVTPLQEDAAPQQPQSSGGPLAPQGGRQPVAKQQPQDVQFQASTGRDVAVRNVPGLENAPIDVEASEVHPNPALGMTRRLSYGGDGQRLEQGQGAAAQPGPGRAGTQQQTPPALPAPSNLRERIEAFRQKQAEAARMAQQVGQAQKNSAQPAQAGQPAGQVAAAAGTTMNTASNDAKGDTTRLDGGTAASVPAQITARQAQQAGAKARQQAKQAQRQAERAQAAPEETGLRVGVAPGSADPVTVRDGVVHIGEYEAVNYDSGEPVTVPKGSTRADVARALKDAGVLSSRQKMFGLSEKAQEVMFSRSAMKSTEANIARGRESLAKALNEKTTAHRAMFRNGLGWVDFVWGAEGTVKPSGRTKGAMGLAHVLEARQRKDGYSRSEAVEFLNSIVDTIARGSEFDRKEVAQSTRVGLIHQETIVWLSRHKGSNAWVVTGYEKTPSGTAAGRATAVPTHDAASLTRSTEEGVAPIMGEQHAISNPAGFSQEGKGAKILWSGSEPRSAATGRQPLYAGSPDAMSGQDAPIAQGENSENESLWSRYPVPADASSVSARDTDANPDILYSKSAKPVTNPTAVKMRRAMVQRTVDALTKGWAKAPNVTVVDSMQDERVPEAVRKADAAQRSQGAMGEPEGFWYRGQVYLVASALPTSADAARVLYHEVLGHHGLRGHFGKDLDRVLDQVIKLRRKDVQAKAQEYGLDMGNPVHAGHAAEEVLAELAQSRPDLGFVQRAIAAIRNFLRAHVPGFKALELTDADIVQGYLLPARGWVERGGVRGAVNGDTRFSFAGERAKAGADTIDQTDTAAFKRWFGDSKVVDADGKPLVVYHGSRFGGFSVFMRSAGGFIYTTPNADYASRFSGSSDGSAVYPVYVSIKKPLDLTHLGERSMSAEEARVELRRLGVNLDEVRPWEGAPAESVKLYGDGPIWRLIREDRFSIAAKNAGFDGIKINEGDGEVAWVAFESNQLKSATGNNGNFDPENPDIRFSRSQSADAIRSSMGALTPDQEAAWKKVAGLEKVPTLRERWESIKANLGTRMKQALVDQFAPIAELDQHAYMLARMSKGSDGTLEAALLYGRPFLRDGVPDVDVKEGGFAKVLADLKGEQDRFLMWVAAQRAERLKAEGKENLFSDQDISSLKTLNDGQMPDGSSRKQAYAKALIQLNSFNESVLRMAKESGLIDQAAYELMKDQPYVPFYRLMEDEGGLQGPTFSKGLTNQKAWKKLKGGTQQLNADLLQNMLLNWGNLYAASARNRAALATMDAAEKMAIAYKVPSDTKGAAKVMRDGVTEYWMVEDPYLLEAISALNYQASPLMKPLAAAKKWLTLGVTVNPTFKVRNLIRDVVSSMAMADLSYNPAANVAKGWKLTARDSQVYASMLASGGVIRFGTQEQTDRARRQVAKLSGVVLDQTAWKKLWGQLKALYEAYDDFGDRTENINRAALYERLIQKGHSHAEASFMARDLMDFSMSGSAPVVRFLTQSVPFLNARMQGLYKLGRAAKEDPRRFATVAMAVSMASLGLLAAYADDEDWKRREDWDRDSYWWFKIGQTAYRIPKPFEVGAIGTLAERTAEAMFDDEMDSKRFMERISHMVSQTFAFDPVPQAVKPLLDIYANKDSFTGRAIESMADQRLRPQDRYNEKTSEVARLLGQMGLPDPAQLIKGEYVGLSPKQIDHLLRGYFSWMATAATMTSDMLLRSTVVDRGEAPDMRLKDMPLVGNFAESLPAGGSRYVTALYEQSRAIEQAYASYQDALKSGERDKAAEIMESEGDKIRSRSSVAAATKLLSQLNAQAKRIQEDPVMSGEEKRARLTQLEQRRHEIAKRVMGRQTT